MLYQRKIIMEIKEIFEKVQEIFRDELDNDNIILKPDTTAEDIEEWDSVANVQIMAAIEKAFNIKITAYEMTSWIDVGEMIENIQSKLQ